MTSADIHVCSCGKPYPADVDPHEWKPRGAAADKPPANAANPVVPESAVEAYIAAEDAWCDVDANAEAPYRELVRAALAAAAPDLIAANNTDDTKADALEEAEQRGARKVIDGMLTGDDESIRLIKSRVLDREAATWGAQDFTLTSTQVAKIIRDRAATLRTDTTHKDQP